MAALIIVGLMANCHRDYQINLDRELTHILQTDLHTSIQMLLKQRCNQIVNIENFNCQNFSWKTDLKQMWKISSFVFVVWKIFLSMFGKIIRNQSVASVGSCNKCFEEFIDNDTKDCSDAHRSWWSKSKSFWKFDRLNIFWFWNEKLFCSKKSKRLGN